MIIYCTVNKVNGKLYVGKDKNNNPDYYGSGKNIKNVLNKHGNENFTKIILEEVDKNNWKNKERYWIKLLKTQNPLYGYNIHEGGNGLTNDFAKELGRKQRGKNNPFYGKIHSKEVKEKISKTKKGKKLSAEHKQNISKSNKGKKKTPFTESHIQNLSKSHLGHKHSKETKRKMSESSKKENLSPETRKRISDSIKLHWSKRRAG